MDAKSKHGFDARMKKSKRISNIVTISVIIILILSVLGVLTLRFDFAAGSHRIIPTAIDTNFWGHYRVYFRGAHDVFQADRDEDHYYILSGNTELVEQVRQAMINNQEIIVFYQRWVGFKPIGSPQTGPIYRIEIIGG